MLRYPLLVFSLPNVSHTIHVLLLLLRISYVMAPFHKEVSQGYEQQAITLVDLRLILRDIVRAVKQRR
jgi:hypothetical protein